jgi:hypothetical protein
MYGQLSGSLNEYRDLITNELIQENSQQQPQGVRNDGAQFLKL